jgi:hypothetical protein
LVQAAGQPAATGRLTCAICFMRRRSGSLAFRSGRGGAKARILELLAGHSVRDLRTMAENAHVSVTTARALAPT